VEKEKNDIYAKKIIEKKKKNQRAKYFDNRRAM